MLLQRRRGVRRFRQNKIRLGGVRAIDTIVGVLVGRVEELVLPYRFLALPADDVAFLDRAFESEFAEVDAVVQFRADVGAFVALGAGDGVGDYAAGFGSWWRCGGVESRVAGFDGVGAVVEDEGFGRDGCCGWFGGLLAGHG
jgi:hypothetical protein